MGNNKSRQADRAGRPPMSSPGRPPVGRREHRQRFWEAIARGLSSEDAGRVAGVSPVVGCRWFRESGGMPSSSLAPLSGRYLSFAEQEEVAILHAQHVGVRAIARRLLRSPATISRELRRNAATRGGALEYRATTAQWHADRRARRPKVAKLAANGELRRYVQERLAGVLTATDGTAVPGPEVRWKGRRHGPRKDRRWATAWSPEQIGNRLRVDFPEDASMRVSHEAIYQALYVQDRGALRRELVSCLRTGRALRVPRARTRTHGKTFVGAECRLSQRPPEVTDRRVLGHWEGDLILGLGSSAIGTRVERTTRFTLLLHLPRMDAHGQPRVKKRPCSGRTWFRSGPRCHHLLAHNVAGAAAPDTHVGPRGRDGSACPPARRHGLGHLLLCPTQSMAARHEREHQRTPPSVLPERDGPVPLLSCGAGHRRPCPQQPATQDAWLENTCRGSQLLSILTSTKRRCDDRLNPSNTPRWPSDCGAGRPECVPPWGA